MRTPTSTPLRTYPVKRVMLHYYSIGGHSIYDSFRGQDLSQRSKLVLYEDGLMILVGDSLLQKQMAPSEADALLSTLEALGFYTLRSNQKHDETDPLYNFDNTFRRTYDGADTCVYVSAAQVRELCAYVPDLQFLVPQMRAILRHLDQYPRIGMTQYYPDRVLLWARNGRDSDGGEVSSANPAWDPRLPSLEALTQEMSCVGGSAATELSKRFAKEDIGIVFTESGADYTVYLQFVLPHEVLTLACQ